MELESLLELLGKLESISSTFARQGTYMNTLPSQLVCVYCECLYFFNFLFLKVHVPKLAKHILREI
jgi:hypothetical protein